MSNQQPYEVGDWIVHSQHGVGQVKGVVEKHLAGKDRTYVRVQTSSSTIFVPLEQICDEAQYRPVATTAECKEVIKILGQPPEDMDSNYKVRRSRISRVASNNSLESVARLVRDLWARNRQKRLNQSEQSAYRRYRDLLLAEWSIAMQQSLPEAEAKLQEVLNEAEPA